MSNGSAANGPSSPNGSASKLNVERHVRYWLRCLKTYLPNAYTSNDCNRLTLAFFTLAALDLLDCLNVRTTEEEREDYINWIYACQHPDGGFRGSPATDLGERRNEQNKYWDPGNLAATYFALASLLILGDDLKRVKRKECLSWLNKLQRQDGSFGETLGENGKREGGRDTRFAYCGTCVRWILRGQAEGEVDGVADINIDSLVENINRSETYDGGISEAPYHEAHAGFTNCAINSLAIVNRLPNADLSSSGKSTGLTKLDQTLHWLCSRQVASMTADDTFDTLAGEIDDPDASTPYVPVVHSNQTSLNSDLETEWAGFNGRCNKLPDTCYAWWVCASLATLGRMDLVDVEAARRYLLDQTQHVVGGFGKTAGDPPDILHSYLGLATLSLMGKDGLKECDSILAFSKDAKRHAIKLLIERKIPINSE